MEEIKNKIKACIGFFFIYKGTKIKIEDVKFVGSNTVVKTNVRAYNFLDSELSCFFDELVLVNSDIVEKTKQEPPINQVIQSSNIDYVNFSISNVLIDAISRVKHDKDYVNQANAICNLTSQIINVKKLELQMSKK
jgi:hypothetical protein